MEARRVDLANRALRTSPKLLQGLKYQFHQGFFIRSEIRKSQSPLSPIEYEILFDDESFLYSLSIEIYKLNLKNVSL